MFIVPIADGDDGGGSSIVQMQNCPNVIVKAARNALLVGLSLGKIGKRFGPCRVAKGRKIRTFSAIFAAAPAEALGNTV